MIRPIEIECRLGCHLIYKSHNSRGKVLLITTTTFTVENDNDGIDISTDIDVGRNN